jgi:exopolysaccharide biosynthesis polyprenyl glycosylphosphotransferase
MKLETAATPLARRRRALPRLRLRTSERKLLLGLVDILLINAALAISWLLAASEPLSFATVTAPYKWYITLTLVWLAAAFVFDVYDLVRSSNTINILRNISGAALSTVLVYTLIPWLTPPLQNRLLLFVFAGLVWGWLICWRALYALLFVQPQFRQRALVVGAGWSGRTLIEAFSAVSRHPSPVHGAGYELVGVIDDNPAYWGTDIAGVPVLGGHELLTAIAEELQIDEIILAITRRHAIADALFDELLRCREQGIHLASMPSVYGNVTGRIPVQHVGRDLFTAMPSGDRPSERVFSALKRLTDLFIAALGLGAVGLLAVLVALANRWSSPGPLFYRQTRIGQRGRTFQMIKFRSMIPNAEGLSGAVWAALDDSRITPVGKLLRRMRLDELPQLVNVLRGEMSIIGPRPERPEFVEQLSDMIPFYRARHAVRPGITGWAQVSYRYGSSADDARIKLEYDLYYVNHMSALMDIRIVLRTIQVMATLKGQ